MLPQPIYAENREELEELIGTARPITSWNQLRAVGQIVKMVSGAVNVVTFDDLVAFGPYLVSILAFIAAMGNIWYTRVKDRPKIKITFRKAKITSKRVDAVCIHITNIGGRSITILFPDIILPDESILYLRPGLYPSIYADPRKKGLEPNLAAGALSGWPTYFQHPNGWGKTPPFPYELAPGKLSEVWVENTTLACELKKLHYSGEVTLKVCVTDASEKPHVSDEIIFDIDKKKLRLPVPKVGFWSRIFGGGRKKE